MLNKEIIKNTGKSFNPNPFFLPHALSDTTLEFMQVLDWHFALVCTHKDGAKGTQVEKI